MNSSPYLHTFPGKHGLAWAGCFIKKNCWKITKPHFSILIIIPYEKLKDITFFIKKNNTLFRSCYFIISEYDRKVVTVSWKRSNLNSSMGIHAITYCFDRIVTVTYCRKCFRKKKIWVRDIEYPKKHNMLTHCSTACTIKKSPHFYTFLRFPEEMIWMPMGIELLE